jgi:hypothetical protein
VFFRFSIFKPLSSIHLFITFYFVFSNFNPFFLQF